MFKRSTCAAIVLAPFFGSSPALTPPPWFNAQSDEFRAGAFWWLGDRHMPALMPCEVLSGDAVKGCLAMKTALYS
jgi:hypothetical protein